MKDFVLHQLRCFDAVIRTGSFQAAADTLNRTHPSVYSATKMLERQVGVALFDRSGYRVALTEAGRAFHSRVQGVLNESAALNTFAAQLVAEEETVLSLVIGDVSPIPDTLGLLKAFFERHPNTRLDLHFEALAGPLDRLLNGQADIIIHHVDRSDMRLEFIALHSVRIIPVVAPGFLDFAIDDKITPEKLRGFPQCIIRDTAIHLPAQDYYIVDGAHHWTVGDQMTKKEVILQGMGWGHLPDFLIRRELGNGRLLPITGRYFQGGVVEIAAVRLRKKSHGPVANRLWRHLKEARVADGSVGS